MEKEKERYPELATNSKFAKRVVNCGEDKHTIRNEFERDRDRIMYSRAFRRLSGKTQVFLAGNDDHVRTRLTHTLEVAQIARTISKALGLNEYLTEAIALGHDIGHTPFGHIGERMLNSIMNGCYKIKDFNDENDIIKDHKGFKHNWQSLRAATVLEPNMNLTNYTLWGILNHSSLNYSKCIMKDNDNNCFLRHEKNNKCEKDLKSDDTLSFYKNMKISRENEENLYEAISKSWSFEGYVVAIADEIAQRHHDIEDALEYNMLEKEELLKKIQEIFSINDDNYFKNTEENIKNFKELEVSIKSGKSFDEYIPKFSKFIVNLLTTDVILNTRKNFNHFIKKYDIKDINGIGENSFHLIKDTIYEETCLKEDKEIKYVQTIVSYNNFIKDKDKQLQKFLKNTILNSHKAQTMDGVGKYVIKELFKAYLLNPQQLPDKTIVKLFKNLDTTPFNYVKSNCTVGELRNKLQNYHFNNFDEFDCAKSCAYTCYKRELLRTICDYISGMTDKYTIEQHRKLYNII